MQGANPSAPLLRCEDSEYGEQACGRIDIEISFLALELFPVYREVLVGERPELRDNDYRDLLGLAEHVKMSKLFEKYRCIWNKE